MTLNVYLIPGMSAGRESFEALTLSDHCSATVIPWLLPKRKEPLIDYAKRMLVSIDTQAPFVLIGVSFGGIVAQEALNF